MNIPDDQTAELGVGFQNLGRSALEALAAEAYANDVLSLEQVRRLLDLLRRLYGRITVTETIRSEALHAGAPQNLRKMFSRIPEWMIWPS